MLLELTFTWPETAILIAVTVVLSLLGRLLLGYAIRKVVAAAINRARVHADSTKRADRLWAQATGMANERFRQRAETLGSLLGSIATFVIALVAILTIMGAIGLPLAPVLASAGVGGVALGFGAQSIVKDLLSGIFMIVEDQFGVGDVITVNDVTGTVEEVSLRITRIRDASGMVWHIRNGEIVKVGNLTQGWSTAIIDIPVAYDEDPEKVVGILRDVVTAVDADEMWSEHLIEEPNVVGVESISGGTMTVRIIAKCGANQHWGVQREIRERAKVALDAAGVRGPAIVPGAPGA